MFNFNKYIFKLIEDFKCEGFYREIENMGNMKIEWPEGYGVYTIWHKSIDYRNLLYVGHTGKYKRKDNGDIEINDGAFSKRTHRWTPYRFCESPKDIHNRYELRFGPKFASEEQRKKRFDPNAYFSKIPYCELLIATFNLKYYKIYTPATLEALILNEYLKEDSKLPPANNQL